MLILLIVIDLRYRFTQIHTDSENPEKAAGRDGAKTSVKIRVHLWLNS